MHFLFFVGITLDLASIALLIPFLHLFLQHVGLDQSSLPFVQSIYGLCQTFSLWLFGGFLSEIFGHRKVLLVSLFATILAAATLFASLNWKIASLLFLNRFVLGIGRQTITMASTILFDEAGEDEATRARSLSLLQSSASLGFVFSPALGGWIIDEFGVEVLALCSCFFGILGFILIWISTRDFEKKQLHERKLAKQKEDDEKRKEKKLNPLQKLIEAFKHLLLDKKGEGSHFLVFAIFANSFSYCMAQSHKAVYLTTKFGFTSSELGRYVSFASLLGAVTQFWSVRFICGSSSSSSSSDSKKPSPSSSFFSLSPRGWLLLLSWTGSLAGASLIALAETREQYIFGLVFQSLCSGSVDAMSKAALSMHFPPESTALGSSISYQVDGANRMMLPFFNNYLVSNFYLEMPMFCSAAASIFCSLCHTLGTTGSNLKPNNAVIAKEEHKEEGGKVKRD